MEGRKKKVSSSSSSSSSSSLTSELFGSRENPLPSDSSSSSSSMIFGSIFAPPSKFPGRESLREDRSMEAWNDKSTKSGDVDRNKEQQENIGSVYQDQRVQPCHLSSSIYYGGPDVYFQPQNPSINSTNKKDGGEDDSGSASRGNWWQGSLYY